MYVCTYVCVCIPCILETARCISYDDARQKTIATKLHIRHVLGIFV